MNEEIVDFKSSKEYFKDEKEGLTNHTERVIDIKDERFQKLLLAWKNKEYPLIRINQAEYCSEYDKAKELGKDMMNSFIREIKHIKIWKEIMSITWIHK